MPDSTSRRPIPRKSLAGIFILSLFAVSACTGLSGPRAPATPREVLSAGLSGIETVYVRSVSLRDVTLAGLSRLSQLDRAISVSFAGNNASLKRDNIEIASFILPSEHDPSAWADLAADVVAAAKTASPTIAQADNEAVYELLFDGFVSKLDRFSRYTSAKETVDVRASREGFGGVGIRVAVEEQRVRILSVQHYTPAERAGLRADDVITHIDGQPVSGLDQEGIVGKLRGEEGSPVTVTILRGTEPPFNRTLTRAHITPETVTYERRGDIAYIRLYGFNAATAESLEREVTQAQLDMGDGLRGLILDLRNNPGGVLDQSVDVADLFVDSGRIVATRGRNPDSHHTYDATPGDIINGKPIVVLVNGDSASASEIVAAALQDDDRAVVVGSNSYGKGTVQRVIALPNNGEMSLTWARFHAPSGYTLHELGVLPSICTSEASANASKLLSLLRAGRIAALPTAARNATNPDDTAALNKLRANCPAQHGEAAVDLEVASQLLESPQLYNQAMLLAHVDPSAAQDLSAAYSESGETPLP
jgi:carboxyl-terminal processing protease